MSAPPAGADRLILALDVPTLSDAERWVTRTRHAIGTYKIGLQLYCAEGRRAIERLRAAGAARIFLDLKLHDIPNTVAGAVDALADAGVDDLSVHTAGGPAMLAAARRAAPDHLRLLAVTVLTSLDAPALRAIGATPDPRALVLQRARLALDHDIGGLVCSPNELSALRDHLGAAPHLVTPGIRLGGGTDDQKRVATPAAALAAGADRLVIGRAVTAAPDPEHALARLIEATS